jgi:hypothetical protein
VGGPAEEPSGMVPIKSSPGLTIQVTRKKQPRRLSYEGRCSGYLSSTAWILAAVLVVLTCQGKTQLSAGPRRLEIVVAEFAAMSGYGPSAKWRHTALTPARWAIADQICSR